METSRMKKIRISTLACVGDGGVGASLKRAAAMIAEAVYDKADLICLPEIFAWGTLSGDLKRHAAEPINGRFSRAMGRLAARHHTNILSPLLERDGSRIYNSMVWYGRSGQILGKYRKAFPTDYEMAEGITPGPLEFDVFQTEFGAVGCCICFDINFVENIERIASQKARLVIFPSMFKGLSLMCAWAKLYRMYFVSADAYPYAAVVNPLGKTLSEPCRYNTILTMNLNLDYMVLHTDRNKEKFSDIKKAYGTDIEIRSNNIESCALLTSHHPRKSAEDIAAEFGLERESDYYLRSKTLADRNREKSIRQVKEAGI